MVEGVLQQPAKASDILELLAEAKDGVYAVDMNQRVVFWNRGAEEMLGHAADDVLGRRCYQVFGGLSEDETRVCASNCDVILWAQRGQVAPAHTFLTRTKDGQAKWLSVTHVLLPAERRELSTLVHIFHDATAETEAKRLMQRLNGHLSKVPAMPAPAALSVSDGRDLAGTLTPRELEVLRLLARGTGTRAIAEKLSLTPTTVRNHIQRILPKLGAHNRLEAVAAASRHGLL